MTQKQYRSLEVGDKVVWLTHDFDGMEMELDCEIIDKDTERAIARAFDEDYSDMDLWIDEWNKDRYELMGI